MVSKTVLITGVTGTIGKATAIELLKNDCHLILLGRNTEKLYTVKSEISGATGKYDPDVVIADLSEPKSIKKAVEGIRKRYSSLDALINVAAIFKSKYTTNSTGLEYMFATNHIGPFVLTNEVLPLLKAGKSARVISLSAPSTTKINFDDLQGQNKFSAGFLGAFGASKMMNIMFTYALARRMEGTGVSASVFHPGLVKSDLTNEMPVVIDFFFKSISSPPDKAAQSLCRLATDEKYANSNGKFYKVGGKEIKSNSYSYDVSLQEKLWEISEQLAK